MQQGKVEGDKGDMIMIEAILKPKVLVLIGGEEIMMDASSFLESYGVDGFIRIPEEEFGDINLKSGFVGHFNLEKTNHVVGKTYLLMPILRKGVSGTEEQPEQLPLLSTEGAVKTECVEVQNYLSYDALDQHHFANAMKKMSDKASVKTAIIKRYGDVRSDLSPEEFDRRGVGFTLLKILK